MSTPLIRVMVVDDHAVVRSGLSAFLMAYDDLELVGEAAGGEEAVEMALRLEPDVILMDMMMPNVDGAAATRRIREANPAIQVLALTSFREDRLVEGALQAGAIGYLLKNTTAATLADAIRRAHGGHTTLSPEAAEALVKVATRPRRLGHDLTAREYDVLALMIEGLSNTQIAERLIVSRSTVKFHVSNILSKLHATSRTEAVAMAVQHEMLENREPTDS